MNQTTKLIFAVAFFVLLLLGAIAGFNYYVDPMCYYHCPGIDLTKRTQNVYYQAAQTAVANPDAEILVLGSSRGETTPPKWIEEVTGMKTINLSQGGADLLLKVAVLNAALDAGVKVKKVIWIADYFELVSSSTSIKTKITPAFQKYIRSVTTSGQFSFFLDHLQRIIDHNSFEASLEQLKGHPSSMFLKSGNGSNIDYVQCQKPDFEGETPADQLDKKVLASHSSFVSRLATNQDPVYFDLFEKQIRALEQRGIQVILFIPPFHPHFTERFDKEYPQYRLAREQWLAQLEKLSSPQVQVVNYFSGIPGDDLGPSFWNDGVHMTCKGVIRMLEQTLLAK